MKDKKERPQPRVNTKPDNNPSQEQSPQKPLIGLSSVINRPVSQTLTPSQTQQPIIPMTPTMSAPVSQRPLPSQINFQDPNLVNYQRQAPQFLFTPEEIQRLNTFIDFMKARGGY